MGKVSSKTKKKQKSIVSSEGSLQNKAFLKKISIEDQIILERIKELAHVMKQKHGLTTTSLLHLLDDKEIIIPASIFTKKLSTLESITKYFKEVQNFSYHKIGEVLNRNERNIWNTYKNATKKVPTKLSVTFSEQNIPVSIFQNKLGILENIVLHLKDTCELSYHNIALLLKRDDRTIWSTYQTAVRKLKNK